MNQKPTSSPLPISFAGWFLTIGLSGVAIVLWAQQQSVENILTNDFSLLMLTIGRITGIIGLVLYSLNLLYSTRLRIFEKIFGGLNKVYIAHHIVGGLALVLLCIHPLSLSLQYITSSLRDAGFLLIPHDLVPIAALFDTANNAHESVLQQWAIFGGIVAFWGMVVLLVLTFFIKLPYQIWLFTHKFLGPAFFIAGLHVLFISSDTSSNVSLRYYLLTLAGLGILAFIYRTLLPNIFVRRYRYQVTSILMQNATSVKISLQPLKRVMTYKPGQFVFIQFLNTERAGVSAEWHPFSISSTPYAGPLEITAKALGDYTSNLANIPVGTIAKIEGAYGKFGYYNYKNLNQIWIAGGIGITPFLSMLKSLPLDGYAIDLYYSVRDSSEAIEWQAIVDAAMARGGHLRVIPFDSSQQPGFLDATFVESYSQTLQGKEILLCGPPPMMKALTKQLRQAGVRKSAIHSEEFSIE